MWRLLSVSGLVSGSLVVVAVLACNEAPTKPAAGSEMSPAFAVVGAGQRTALGGVDLDGYCQSLGFAGVTLTKPRLGPNAAYNNWRRLTTSGETHPFSFEQACKAQYGLEAVQRKTRQQRFRALGGHLR